MRFMRGANLSQMDNNLNFPLSAVIASNAITVTLADGTVISNSLDMHQWLKRVYETDPHLLNRVELTLFSVWWPDIDEGLDIEGMILNIPSN